MLFSLKFIPCATTITSLVPRSPDKRHTRIALVMAAALLTASLSHPVSAATDYTELGASGDWVVRGSDGACVLTKPLDQYAPSKLSFLLSDEGVTVSLQHSRWELVPNQTNTVPISLKFDQFFALRSEASFDVENHELTLFVGETKMASEELLNRLLGASFFNINASPEPGRNSYALGPVADLAPFLNTCVEQYLPARTLTF